MKLLWVTALCLLTTMSVFAQYYGPGNRAGYGYENNYGRQGMRERLPLHINQHLRGQNILMLKKELRMQYPGILPKDLQLIAVKLVAKSKRGMGQATLVVGQDASYPVTVGGSGYDFHNDHPQTFDKVRIQNPAIGQARGKWQIKLQGNIKVKKVVLIVKRKMGMQNIHLNLRGTQVQGFDVLPLKRLIKQQNPMIDLMNVKLLKVTLVAKSARGRGQATLVTGYNSSYPATIPMGYGPFNGGGPQSFNQVTLTAPYMSSTMGKWQVELQGRIKIKEVIVTIQSQNGAMRPGPVRPTRPVNPPRRRIRSN